MLEMKLVIFNRLANRFVFSVRDILQLFRSLHDRFRVPLEASGPDQDFGLGSNGPGVGVDTAERFQGVAKTLGGKRAMRTHAVEPIKTVVPVYSPEAIERQKQERARQKEINDRPEAELEAGRKERAAAKAKRPAIRLCWINPRH